jgi:hypothetical protein
LLWKGLSGWEGRGKLDEHSRREKAVSVRPGWFAATWTNVGRGPFNPVSRDGPKPRAGLGTITRRRGHVPSQPSRDGIDDADTSEGARGIVRGPPPGRYDVDEIRAEPFPSGHTSRQCGRLIRHPDGPFKEEPWAWLLS